MKTKLKIAALRASVVTSAFALAAIAGTAYAEETAAPAPAAAAAAPKTPAEKLAEKNAPGYARKLAGEWCSACHGPDGRSRNPLFPALAAQSDEYLVTQLRAFHNLTNDDTAVSHETFYEKWIKNVTGLRKSERYEDAPRNEERAWDFMKGVARDLDDPTIQALATLYSKQTAIGGRTEADAATLAKGKKLFDEGDMAKGLLPCQSCHGPDAHGNGPIPRLAGQYADYVVIQMKSIKSGIRAVDQMQALIQNLDDSDIQAVAAYVQSLN